MKKSDFETLLVYALMFVIAIFVGMTVIGPALDKLELTSTTSRYAFAIISILLGLIFNIVLFEVGHIIGAKIGKYRVRSMNVLGLCFYKIKNKWRFTFRSFNGLTGETKIAAKSDKASPKMYSWFPLILYVIEVIALITAYSLIPEPSTNDVPIAAFIKYSSLIFVAIGGMIMLYNIMPFQMDTMNDGYRLALISKPINVQAFNALSVIEEKNENEEELDQVVAFEEITTLTSQVNLIAVYQRTYQADLETAGLLVDELVANKNQLNIEVAARAAAQKVYFLLQNNDLEAAEAYFMNTMDKETRKFVGNDLALPTLRAYFLYSGLVSKSVSECAYVLGRLQKAKSREVNRNVIDAENVLFKASVAQVRLANPTWEFAAFEEVQK
ncbi:MAG: hypothetical protein WCR35_03780 [Bacilli bacterium]